MARKTETEQLGNGDRIDSVRKELDTKIDNKLSTVIFLGVIGTIAVLMLSIASSYMTQANTAINKLDGQNAAAMSKIDELNKRITILETIASERNSKQNDVPSALNSNSFHR